MPSLKGLQLSSSTFTAASHGGSVGGTHGVTVSYVLSIAATTEFTITRPAAGVRHHQRCVAPPARRRGPNCTRYVFVGSFLRSDGAGRRAFTFTGRLNGHRLRAGRYRLQAVPHANNKTGRASIVSFRVAS